MSAAAAAFWAEGGASSYLDDVAAEAAASGVAAATVPEPPPRGMADALAERLLDQGFHSVFRAGPRDPGRSVVHRLAMSAGLPGGALRTVASILASPEVGAGAFLVDAADPADAGRWATLAATFAGERRRMSAPLLPSLVVLSRVDGLPGTARFPTPERDLRWIDRVSSADMRRFVERLRGPARGLAAKLATETAAELAGSDPGLAEALAALPDAALMDPAAALEACRGTYGDPFRPGAEPTWGNGGCDAVDGAAVRHALSLLADGDLGGIGRRAWRAQARILVPFIEEVLAHLRRKYAGFLADALPAGDGVTDGASQACGLELPAMRAALAGEMTEAEKAFTRVLHSARNVVAHHGVVPPRHLTLLSGAWAPMLAEAAAAAHWTAPRRGQRVVLSFGSDPAPGATDGRHPVQEVVDAVTASLAAGEDALVAAADGLGRAGRLRVALAVPGCFEVVYRVGPGAAASPDLADILAGDGRGDVTVEDGRGASRR